MDIKKIILTAICLNMLMHSHVFADTIEGYIKSRVELFNGEYVLNQGDHVTCNLRENNKCCYEEEFGEVCLDMDQISAVPVSKVDLRFAFIRFSERPNKKICAKGKNISSEYRDGFHSQYAVAIAKHQNVPVFIDVRFYYYNGSARRIASNISKQLFINADNSCKTIDITNEDINKLILEHESIKQYLDIDFYTSSIRDTVKGKLVFNLVSGYTENDYANNHKEVDIILPVDSSENWTYAK